MPPRPSLEKFSCFSSVRMQETNFLLGFHGSVCNTRLEVHGPSVNQLDLTTQDVGRRHKAHQSLDCVVNRNNFSMSRLITSLIKCGDLQHAFNMYQKMCEDFLHLDECTLLALLKACTELKDVEKGNRIYSEILERGLLEQHLLLGNALINMYAKCGVFGKAQEVFNMLPVRDVVSWNALLAGYVKHGRGEKALEYFEHMQLEGVSPDAVTFVCILKACGTIGAVDKGRAIHVEIATNGLLKRNLIVGNALMDMYGKCCLLAKAEEVFDNLDVRDVISWNTLMTGYVKEDQGEKALKFYDQMQLDGVSRNAITFVCGLKACGLVKATSKGQEIHDEIRRNGLLEKNLVVGNAVVDMYSKWGWLEKAQEVFDMLITHDVDSWNALLSGYAKLECGEEALKCFEEMQHQGVFPDGVTFVSSLKACGCIGSAVKGIDIHFEIERRGLLEGNLVVGTALIDMYAKCGWLAHAQELFDGLLLRDLISWNALIVGYVEHGYGKEALICFEQMQLERVSPNALTFACSLKACGILESAEKGCEMHVEIARKGLSDCDIIVGNALVDMYAKCGLLALAREVFEKLLIRDVVSWTALITGHNDIDLGEEALKYFEQMQLEGVFPDGVTLACTLKACGSLGMIHKGKSIHARIAETRLLERDLVIGTALCDMYAKCGLLGEAQKAFSCLPVRDIVSWNALIAGYARYELSKQASKCVEQMGVEGISPDVTTLVCTLRACSGIRAMDKARKYLNESARRKSFEGDLFVGSTLVDMYAKSGCLAKALELFGRLPARDIISWNTLITGLANHECSEEALNCLKQMQIEGILPDDVTFVCSLKACGSTGATDKGREIHAEIARRGFLERHLVVGNALIDMYSKCGWLAKAQEVFNNLFFRDVISWNVLISGYAQLGDSEKVFSLFDRMRREGQKPDSVTFISVLHTCSQAVLVERGQVFFETMSKDYGINPTLEHHTCLIDLFARAGVLHQAVSKINNLPSHSDFVVWLTFLDACRRVGNVELGEEAHGYALHPKSNGTTVQF